MLDLRSPRRFPLAPAWVLGPLAACASLCGVTAWLIVGGHRLAAGLAALGAAAALVSAGTQAIERPGPAALVYYLVDRLFDAAVLGPVAWAARSGSTRTALLALVGLGASYTASYERARGRSLGYLGVETVPYRAAGAALLVLALLTGLVEGGLWAFAGLSVAAAAARAVSVVAQQRRAALSSGSAGAGDG